MEVKRLSPEVKVTDMFLYENTTRYHQGEAVHVSVVHTLPSQTPFCFKPLQSDIFCY